MAADTFLEQRYELAGRQIDPIAGNLLYQGKKSHLRRKELEVLALLAAADGACVRRNQFIDQIWQGNPMVGEQGLTGTIAALRSSLHDKDNDNPLIRTIPRKGYQLNAGVSLLKRVDGPVFAAGAEIGGRPGWTLAERIGHTELSETWFAVESGSGRKRVFKFCRSEQQLQQLRREVALMRYLRESLAARADVVAILDWHLHEPPYFLEYEPYDHGDLLGWSDTQGGLDRVPAATRIALFGDVVTALAAAHSAAIVHRNLTATSIGIDQRDGRWRARLGGFGFGLLSEPERLKQWQLSSAGLSIDAQGAPAPLYRPPGATDSSPTAADDIYALGVLGIQLTIGKWSVPVLAEALAAVRPEGLRDLLGRCLHPEPPGRPDATALQAALDAQLRALRTDAPSNGPAAPLEAPSPMPANAEAAPATPPATPEASSPPPTPAPPQGSTPAGSGSTGDQLLGAYRILEELGHGGMGTVYLAEQSVPVRRKVALKLIKAGVDSEQVLARFEAERQALALMSHPNIAVILESGSTPAGLPYFAMEYVPGTDICSHSDQQKLDVRRRVELFLQVCDGVLHAHQKGIVHRDLKPGNILVRQQAGQSALVKVIDFGVAKSLQGHLVGAGTHTRFGHFVGTPAYCSPEQVASTGQQVDTRSDIYSLGVVLYELLIGVTPRDQADLGNCTPHELVRLLRDSPTPTLIQRFSKLSNELREKIAVQHSMSPEALRHLLSSDLDWVVSKCIAADPEDRYATVQDLRKDLCSWLEHRPVEARPASRLYKFRKLVRRNRATSAMALVVAVALIGTSSAAVLGYLRAERALADAERAAQFQASKLQSIDPARMGSGLQAQLESALRSRALAPEAVEELLAGIDFADISIRQLDDAIFEPSHQTILDDFVDTPVLQATLLQALCDAWFSLGQYAKGLEAQDRVVRLRTQHLGAFHPDTLNSRSTAAHIRIEIGEQAAIAELQATFDDAVQHLGRNQPLSYAIANRLGRALVRDGKFEEAKKLLQDSLESARLQGLENDPELLESLNMLGGIMLDLKEFASAQELISKALAARKRRLGERHRDTLNSMNDLALVLSRSGQPDAAIVMLEEALAGYRGNLGNNHPDTIQLEANLAGMLVANGGLARARQLQQHVYEVRRHSFGPAARPTLMSGANLARYLFELGEHDAALTVADQVLLHGVVDAANADLVWIVRVLRAEILLASDPIRQAAELGRLLQAADSTSGISPERKLSARSLLGMARLAQQDYTGARKILADVLRESVASGLPETSRLDLQYRMLQILNRMRDPSAKELATTLATNAGRLLHPMSHKLEKYRIEIDAAINATPI